MTYKDNFVVEVKCRGKILRVTDDAVRLPFGSEYSIYLKNLNTRRCSVNISIDGEDVLDNQSLILDANSSTELKGFLRGNQATNRFKFINKTKEIQDHRGDKVDDGMIRVQFAFEKDLPEIIKKTIIHEDHHYHNTHHWNYNNWFSGDSTVRYGTAVDGDTIAGAAQSAVRGMASSAPATQNAFYSNVTEDSLGVQSLGQPLNDEGITVKGSEIHQDFRYASMGELERAEVIIIRLKGITGTSTPVQAPITVKTKLTCSTCGRTSGSDAKFCANCGTFLE